MHNRVGDSAIVSGGIVAGRLAVRVLGERCREGTGIDRDSLGHGRGRTMVALEPFAPRRQPLADPRQPHPRSTTTTLLTWPSRALHW